MRLYYLEYIMKLNRFLDKPHYIIAFVVFVMIIQAFLMIEAGHLHLNKSHQRKLEQVFSNLSEPEQKRIFALIHSQDLSHITYDQEKEVYREIHEIQKDRLRLD